MSLLLSQTKWFLFLLALSSGPSWTPVACVSVKAPPKSPSPIETQAKFFQDFFSVQLSPYKIEFGHVCEDPNTWEQRYEKKDYKNHRDMGKVRWGDKKGGYGEHYWDLNHAGHAGNHGNDDYNGHSNSDDGSYNDHDTPSSSYDGPSDHSYGSDDYDPEKSSYEENGRAKRAHPKIKHEKRHKQTQTDEEEPPRPRSRKHKEQHKEQQPKEEPSHIVEKYTDDSEEQEDVPKKPKRQHYKHKYEEEDEEEEEEEQPAEPKEAKNQVVLVVKEKEEPEPPTYAPAPAYVPTPVVDYTKYVPYESGAGVRQHYQPEVTVAAPVPRLFLEPTTGHVVDRATGQAYVLQPIAAFHQKRK